MLVQELYNELEKYNRDIIIKEKNDLGEVANVNFNLFTQSNQPGLLIFDDGYEGSQTVGELLNELDSCDFDYRLAKSIWMEVHNESDTFEIEFKIYPEKDCLILETNMI